MENEGVLDRIVRFVLAIALGVAGSLYVDGIMRLALYVIALGLAISATTGFCLVYKLFGINTKKRQ